jgi:hypothetical protein
MENRALIPTLCFFTFSCLVSTNSSSFSYSTFAYTHIMRGRAFGWTVTNTAPRALRCEYRAPCREDLYPAGFLRRHELSLFVLVIDKTDEAFNSDRFLRAPAIDQHFRFRPM